MASLFWSLIFIAPISIYCYGYIDRKWLAFFSGISLVIFFLPTAFLHMIQLSKKKSIYQALGVYRINMLTQNGGFINALLKKRFTSAGIITQKTARRIISQTYMQEKFHVALFVFFNLTAVYAFMHHQLQWAFSILLTNIMYNVYPALLQQFLRLRLRPLLHRYVTI